MNARTIRRAIEMKARKEARKQARKESAALSATVLNNVETTETAEIPAPLLRSISPVQLESNRRNAQLSTGPKTAEGKAISSQNNFKHGFCGAFQVLESESQQDFDGFLAALRKEHQPASPSEDALVEQLAQHYWLGRRAMNLQTALLSSGHINRENEKTFALYLRYQATHDRGFSKCFNALFKIKIDRRKQEIGFERQKLKVAAEKRRDETHQTRLRIANARAQLIETRTLKFERRQERFVARAQAA